ncbi:MAG: hypothetical protein HAW67_05005 [Endozoicomonadaceae bacterium]|nr:hypothetical protein [Endozoicomonadaceae bacterium]MBE8233074.1 hypothetical protein [Endozoicomonadaceae bacterium]
MQNEQPIIQSKIASRYNLDSSHEEVILGYGVDIFARRFNTGKIDGFKKKPILSNLTKKLRLKLYGKSTFQLPMQAIVHALDYQSCLYLCESNLFNMSKKMSDIFHIELLAGAFHQEIQHTFLDHNLLNQPVMYMLNRHHFVQYAIQLPQYTSTELRSFAQPDILTCLDAYTENPDQFQDQLWNLFDEYGVFICMGALYGGSLNQVTTCSHDALTSVALNHRLGDIVYREKTGQRLSCQDMQWLDFTHYAEGMHFSVEGGRLDMQSALGIGIMTQRAATFQLWKESLKKGENLQFIDFMEEGLLPIWQLAKTPQDALKIAHAFDQWYTSQLISRRLLPQVVTNLKAVEYDAPLRHADLNENERSIALVDQKNKRYVYLIYHLEWAHDVFTQQGDIVTDIHFSSGMKEISKARVYPVLNQNSRIANVSLAATSAQITLHLNVEKKKFTLNIIQSGIHHLALLSDFYPKASHSILYKKMKGNFYDFSQQALYRYAYLMYVPLLSDMKEPVYSCGIARKIESSV